MPTIIQEIELLKRQMASLQSETAYSYITYFLSLPGLRGFWPMSTIDSSGNAYDLSNIGRTLTYNGNPVFNVDGTAPYINLDGTGDYLSRTDEAGLDITGAETYVSTAIQGLTLGGWFYFDSVANTGLLSKFGSSSTQRSYRVNISSTLARFSISNDGTTVTTVDGTALATGAWTFVIGRFGPSSEIAVFVNNVKAANTTSIPASIFNGNEPFVIGARSDATELLDGRASMCFLCAAYLSDQILSSLYQASRPLFRV